MAHWTRIGEWSAVSALAAVIVILAGCTAHTVPRELRDQPLPRGGAPIAPELWSAVDEAPAGEQLITARSTVVPFPLVSRKNWFGVPGTHDLAYSAHHSTIALGIPYWHLPFQHSYSLYRYERGQDEPTGSVKRRMHPFWSWTTQEGNPGPELEARAGGIPLLYHWGNERGYSWYFDELETGRAVYRDHSWWQTLWGLGPARLKVQDQQQLRDAGRLETDESYFFPLRLGGALGILLWAHYGQEVTLPDESMRARGHGPLLGYFGYFHMVEEAPGQEEGVVFDKSESLRLILGGLLWYESTHKRDDITQRSVNGPLWGLFGAGTRNEERVVYLLRIPVKI